MQILRQTLAAAVIALAPQAVLAGDAEWYMDLDVAQKAAKEAGKHLFVDFTGSDWCGYCKIFDEQVLTNAKFLEAIEEDFVLVVLDYPVKPPAQARVPNPGRNAQLKEEHGITGFPTVLLMTSEGQVFGRTNYEQVGPEKFLALVRERTRSGLDALARVLEIVDAYAEAEGEAKTEVLARAVALLETMSPHVAGMNAVATIARDALAVDPKNERGLKATAVGALLRVGKADESIREAARAVDPKNEQGILERLAPHLIKSLKSIDDMRAVAEFAAELDGLGPVKDKGVAIELFGNVANYYVRFLSRDEGAKEKAKYFAQLALERGVENPGRKRVLEQILRM